LVCLLGVESYVSNYDGWGAWAAAPLLLVPAIISLPIVILGLFECIARARVRAPILATVLLTTVSAAPVAWLGVRRFFM
jgi:hypothetical protein